MLRVLLIILAVLSFSLAVVLKQPILYLVAVLLLAVAVALLSLKMKRRHDDVPEMYMQAPDVPEEDLDSLGILDIRPVDVPNAPDPSGDAGNAHSGEVSDADSESDRSPAQHMTFGDTTIKEDNGLFSGVGESVSASTPAEGASERAGNSDSEAKIVGEVRTRRPRPRIMVAEASDRLNPDVILPVLRSLRAAIDACTVCLLRQEESPLRYHVEAIISLNSYARNQGSFTAREPLLAGHEALIPVVYPRVGSGGFPRNRLGYYHEPISVRQVAMVPVAHKEGEDIFVLIADTMNDGGLEPPPVRTLLEQYARLLGTVIDGIPDGERLPGSVPAELRPRRDIIVEEMERARSMSHPLALALVFLNRGEASEEAPIDQLDATESLFEARLREIANDARIEQFGELTYGVFYHGEPAGVATWAGHLQEQFNQEEGDLRGGVSVGVAQLTERHDGPDRFRSDATAALQKAFETGECVIVDA